MDFPGQTDRPLIMGIVNLTLDSFSGDGVGRSVKEALKHARAQWAAGADVLDLGAESTRPGAEPVSLQQELDQILPVLEVLVAEGIPVSVDTCKPEVMVQAVGLGAAMINDIYGFRLPGAIAAVAQSEVKLCVMHMQGHPRSMQLAPEYGDVVQDVSAFLDERVKTLQAAGIDSGRLILDPGFGFGKSLEHNQQLFAALPRLVQRGFPVLVGVSRKSMLGLLTGREQPQDRVFASIAAAVMAAERGCSILRVHDVAATKDALAVWAGL